MTRPQGTIAPILTPFEDDGRIARDLWISHAKWVLGQGAHFLSPFGTTGEALSVSLRERMQALEWLVEAGIAPDRLMPGTGVTALPETAELSAHAVGLGCAAVMVLPSFFYTGAGDNGQARYYGELIEKVAKPSMRMILYHIPQNSGVPVSPALTARLSKAFPDTVVAYKDSAGDWNNTAAVIAAAPDISVFPSSEAQLTKGLANGAAGCISATVNLNAAAIRRLYDAARKGEDVTETDAAVKTFRKVIQDAGLIPAMKAVLAVKSGDRRWLNLRPPHENVTLEKGQALIAALGSAADHIGHS
ncbi:dihydrodipicolinate synthase family protein [Mesorhizobium sp.]|uniref:dihydrodipicolinate synthase family protein n=1 Tax=Mesorhizobium sp. TaxID=1871066 RepID=UPI000FE310A0|nr:dihydrodipicolinate synthase family protein [Mesorhizobium sp.]RWH71068.1 MAG: dihydrodipicolinate synthase family protein [Mesorhizobium sp.]RWL22419.1 MAG: dihydrodipicolinate synthase family protein [Mesorhizobium sp.]RWL31532.1 MAG: dihydrodipicolinate synthase family protein [Mesorhizobium sp.]RWL32720.1 MAG: dihydrodipicolinate synthase family protein [Mesorhizobium sp.]RWL47080.1 MAG: dihydrodipicolinate synthase family protein [Mesorhizobium sp.]